jgi:LysM repeat protein
MRSKPNPPAQLRRAVPIIALVAMALICSAVLAAKDGGARRHAKGEYDAATHTYVVAPGDDLTHIGRRFGISVSELKTLNALTGY